MNPYLGERCFSWNLKICNHNFVVSYFLIRYIRDVTTVWKIAPTIPNWNQRKICKCKSKIQLFKQGALQQQQQQHQWWSNQLTLEPNIWRRMVMSEYDDNPSMMQSSCACACASSEKIALTRVVGLEYLLITWWIFFSRPLNRLQLSARGWGCTTAVTGHSPTSDDHWKPPSTVCVRVSWNSWIRKWRVWCMSDWILTISKWIQDMYWTGFKTW